MFSTSGDKVTIPDLYPYLALVQVGTEFSTYIIIDARLASPGIGGKGVNNLRLHKAFAAKDKSPGMCYDFLNNPLLVGEGKNGLAGDTVTAYSLETDEAGVPHMNHIAMIVSNTKLPNQPHNITHIAKFTTTAIATGLTWEAKTITLDDDLPVGSYRLWGADLCSASAIAARFINDKWGFRPAFIPRRIQTETPNPLNECIHPGGLPFEYRGGALTIKLEFIAETTDTPLSGALFLEYLGQ